MLRKQAKSGHVDQIPTYFNFYTIKTLFISMNTQSTSLFVLNGETRIETRRASGPTLTN